MPGRAHELVPSITVMGTPVVAQSHMVVVGAGGAPLPLGGRKGKHCTSSLCAVSVMAGHSGQSVGVFGGSSCVGSGVALASAASIVVVMHVNVSAVEGNVVPFESLSILKTLL